MSPLDPIVFRELPVIQKVINDETWYEGERRGCHVNPDDPVVRENVCMVVLRIGRQMREQFSAQLNAEADPVADNRGHNQAA